MPSFPQIVELPALIDTKGWAWEPFTAPSDPSVGFWVGTDRESNRWLTKLRGAFLAYREIVFGRLAQNMGWSCQSSVFIRIDAESAKLLKTQPDKIHAAHWLLHEHVYPPCEDNCTLAPLIVKEVRRLEDLAGIPVMHLIDWPKSELAACLFGASGPPGRLFTTAHEFVIIDSELMFASRPSAFDCTTWWGVKSNPSASGIQLSLEVCANLVALGKSGLLQALSIPSGVIVDDSWKVKRILFESFNDARLFRERHRATKTFGGT